MKLFATALACALLLQVAAAEARSNDERRVSETIVEAGNVTLTAERTKDAVTIRLGDDRGSVTMTPAEAVEIGKALAQAHEVHQRLKDRPGRNDVVTHIGGEGPGPMQVWPVGFYEAGSTVQTVRAGELTLTFKSSPKSDFSVLICRQIHLPRRVVLDWSDNCHLDFLQSARPAGAPPLDRAQIEALTPHLLKAVQLAASIEQKQID